MEEKENRVTVYCDGGCSGNGTENAKAYLSYAIGDERPIRHDGLKNAMTNNEAEYRALIEVLSECWRRDIRGPRILMDSALVVNQVNGRWKIKEARLRPLCANAQDWLKRVGAKLEWVERDLIVAKLGH